VSTVRLERDGAVAHVVLDRPAQLNAINPDLLRDLDAVCGALEDDAGVRAVTLTGAGRAFCAGADLRVVEELAPDPARWAEFMELWHRVFGRLERLPPPVVAGVHGLALAWGLVNRVAPAGTVEAATRALAAELAGKSGAASRTAKLLVDRGLDLDLRDGLELEKQKVAAHMRTDDAAAGLRAFRERARITKTPPQDAGGAGAPPSEARITKETS
jgi:enoyl-CoA hydratase/carnithine racemase